MDLTIWHNPRCSKSRQTLTLIEEAGVEAEVRLYVEDPPSPAELTEALRMLDMEPWELARTKEALAREVGLNDLPREQSSREEWVRIMAANPKLIERPVVIAGDGRARLGRPPESVGELLAGGS